VNASLDDNVPFSDEANFSNNGGHNMHYHAQENSADSARTFSNDLFHECLVRNIEKSDYRAFFFRNSLNGNMNLNFLRDTLPLQAASRCKFTSKIRFIETKPWA
jgi:hypothetical protein